MINMLYKPIWLKLAVSHWSKTHYVAIA